MKSFAEEITIINKIGVFTVNEIRALIGRYLAEKYQIGFTDKEWKDINRKI